MGTRETERTAMKPIVQFVRAIWKNRFLKAAVVLSILFCGVHILGFRAHTNIISGTGEFTAWHMYCGVGYLLLYVGFVVLVPIFVIAAILHFGMARCISMIAWKNKKFSNDDIRG